MNFEVMNYVNWYLFIKVKNNVFCFCTVSKKPHSYICSKNFRIVYHWKQMHCKIAFLRVGRVECSLFLKFVSYFFNKLIFFNGRVSMYTKDQK